MKILRISGHFAQMWDDPVHIRVIGEGDSLSCLEDVNIRCIWPFDNADEPTPVPDESVNHFSLAFLVTWNSTQILITSDIDSSAEKKIALRYGKSLQSQIMVVPHHGSAGSVNENLFRVYQA